MKGGIRTEHFVLQVEQYSWWLIIHEQSKDFCYQARFTILTVINRLFICITIN